ncbi:MAG: MFS transporter [Thaumarchaeota archaeon]|nr:MFS transporter [Nitrososphaerota archaeon]
MRTYVSAVLLACSLAWFWNFASRLAIPAISPIIKQSFGYSTAEISLLISMLTLGIGLSYIPSGLAARRFGDRNVVFFAVSLTATALLASALTNNLYSTGLFFFLAGAGLGGYLPAGVSLLSSSHPTDVRGLVFGIHESAASLGMVMGPVAAGIILSRFDWRGPLLFLGLFGIIILPLLLRLTKSSSRTQQRLAGEDSVEAKNWGRRGIVLAAAAFMGVTAIDLGLVSIIPLYLTDVFRLDAVYVALVFGASRVFGMVTKIIAGIASDRFGRLPVILFTSVTSMTLGLAIATVASSAAIIALLFALTSVCAMFYPVIFAAVSDHAPRSNVSSHIGVVTALGSTTGAGVTPAIIGALAQGFGYRVGFIFPIVLGVVGFLSIILLRKDLALNSR